MHTFGKMCNLGAGGHEQTGGPQWPEHWRPPGRPAEAWPSGLTVMHSWLEQVS